MAEATVLGSLLIQLGMDSAQFERATQRAQSSVQKMAQSIGAQAKDVVDASNRMGVSVTSFATRVTNLQARLNPGVQAVSSYKREMGLLREAFRIGAISQDQFKTGVQSALTTYRSAGQAIKQTGSDVRETSGAVQAGMQQLGFQLNDVVTQLSSGTSVMQVFAQQGSQVFQALSLMGAGGSAASQGVAKAGETADDAAVDVQGLGDTAIGVAEKVENTGTTFGKFAAFMAGPWGAAVTAGIVILSALVPKLLETEDAMKDVELASDGLADAQSALGDMFDLTTGKLKSQNDMLRLNAQIMAFNLQMQAAAERASSQRTLGTFGTGHLGLSTGQKVLGALGVPVNRAMNRETAVRQVAQELNAGKIDSETAFARASKLSFDGLGVTKKDFLAAIRDGVSYPQKQKISDAILKSLKDGQLDPSLRTPDTSSSRKEKEPNGKTAEQIADEQSKAIGQLNQEELRARQDLTTSVSDRTDIELQMLADEKAQRLAEIDNNKDLSDEQKAAQKAYLERLYGPTQTDSQITVGQTGLYQQKIFQQEQEKLAEQAQDMVSRQAATLQAMADVEPDLRKRYELEKQALTLQQQIQTSMLEQQIANGQIADADQARAQLAQQQAVDRQKLDIQNMSPLQAYRYNLQSSVANINDAMESIQVDGIQSLTDGLAGAVAGTQKLGDVFKNVAQQIIADLVKIQIQKAIVGTLGSALNLGGLFGGTTSLVSNSAVASAAGGYDFSAIPLAGARATGGPVTSGLPYLVGERGPEIVVPGSSGQVIPNDELSGLGGSTSVQIVPSQYFDAVVDTRAANVAAPMAVASGVQARGAAGSDVVRANRRRIPGR